MSTGHPLVLARRLALSILLLALMFWCRSFSSSGFEKVHILESVGNKMTSSIMFRNFRRLESPLVKRSTKYTNRKLLQFDDICTKSDISIFQGEVNPLPNGIPTFSVQIMNLCPIGCSASNIHVACGWFASAKLINPQIFRRLNFNDCLVNDGNPLEGGDAVSFEYSNSFEYPMRVEAAVICRSK